jgi:hypothetical protein
MKWRILPAVALTAGLLGVTVTALADDSATTMASAAAVRQTGFEAPTAGAAYTLDRWAADGWTAPWELGMGNRTAVTTEPVHSGAKALRVFYPKGKIGPEDSGAQAPFALTPERELYMSQWVRFSPDFSFGTTSFAGKVGVGLAGGRACSGGQVCDGTNGFSSRFIWLSGGRAGIYYYSMDHSDTYGDSEELKPGGTVLRWPSDRWVNVVQRVRVNTVTGGQANADGELRVWVDGVPAATVEGLRFVTNGDLIDKAYFSSFAGGADTAFAPTVDSYVYYDDLEVSAAWPATAVAEA